MIKDNLKLRIMFVPIFLLLLLKKYNILWSNYNEQIKCNDIIFFNIMNTRNLLNTPYKRYFKCLWCLESLMIAIRTLSTRTCRNMTVIQQNVQLLYCEYYTGNNSAITFYLNWEIGIIYGW